MDFIDITLAGRDYKLRYTADDVLDICRRLTAFQPVGGGKVTTTMLGQALLGFEPDALQACVWAGLRHINQYKDIDPSDAQKLISAHISKGGQYEDIRLGIFRGLVKCGLASFSAIVKLLEEDEAKRAADGAIEMTVEQADAETDPGNGLTPTSSSPTRHSEIFSLARDSESST
jgi:hypothetical protein